MKKIYLLACVPFVLAGCAAGINHNIAKINGKTYLVETKNKNVFGLAQWSEPSTLTDLEDQDIIRKTAEEKVEKIVKQCKRQEGIRAANRAQKASTDRVKVKAEPNSEAVYKCIVETLSHTK